MKGFTLIEILVYIALCSFIFVCGSGLLEAYNVTYTGIEKTLSDEEAGLFLLQKIELFINTNSNQITSENTFDLPDSTLVRPEITASLLLDASSTKFTSDFLIGSSSFNFTSYK